MTRERDDQIAFPTLEPDLVDRLREFGEVRRTEKDQVLFSEGDRGFDFFVVLDGAVEILETASGSPNRVTVHGPGEFTGDVDMLTGRAALVTARVEEPGEVLAISAEGLRTIVGQVSEVSETLLQAFLMRRTLLLDQGYEGLKIIGSRFSPEAHRLRDFATRNALPFTWLDLEREPAADELLDHFGVRPEETPVVIGRGGELLRNPSLAELGKAMGLDAQADTDELFDLVVVGGGPAGLGAAVYAASEGLRTLVVEAVAVGGQAGTSTRIENYLGFPAGISGAELTQNAMLQAQKFGASMSVPHQAARLRLEGGYRVVELEDGSEIMGRCVLVSSGAEYRQLGVPDLERFEGAGVYYAATENEARLCTDDDLAVVGGGNSAGQAAVYLSGLARTVHLILRGDDLGKSMSRYLVDRIQRSENIRVRTQTEVRALHGDEHLEAVDLETPEGQERLDLKAVFVFIGAEPHTDWLDGCVKLDRKGFVMTGPQIPRSTLRGAAWSGIRRSPFLLETSLPGVFAAGDVRSGSIKRVSSAVGEGAMAVTFIHQHLGTA
ncbi:MAG: FAD-dependent oxidoreductase [Gemmatimonadota bacterium]|nr:FAD-dependent oxidoreductase [Gemmatimonadota bacterium]